MKKYKTYPLNRVYTIYLKEGNTTFALGKSLADALRNKGIKIWEVKDWK